MVPVVDGLLLLSADLPEAHEALARAVEVVQAQFGAVGEEVTDLDQQVVQVVGFALQQQRVHQQS